MFNVHVFPFLHGPLHVPPHPSESPHLAVPGQEGVQATQVPMPVFVLQIDVPMHVPQELPQESKPH